jgi:hypothetical protein
MYSGAGRAPRRSCGIPRLMRVNISRPRTPDREGARPRAPKAFSKPTVFFHP